MKNCYLISILLIILLQFSCINKERAKIDKVFNSPTFKKELNRIAKEEFLSDFNYKISLIELHKKRYGNYPDSLKHIKFLTHWDNFNRYAYTKKGEYYELNVILDSVNRAYNSSLNLSDIKCPDEFWHGIGILNSNLK
jgi:hypothetical protein